MLGTKAQANEAQRRYELVDFFGVGGGAVGAEAINEGGVVTIRSIVGLHAVDARTGAERLLSACNGCQAPGVNAAGDIAGFERSRFGNFEGFVIRDGVRIAIPPFPGGDSVFAEGMNERGWVVGGAETADSFGRAFLFQEGAMRDLGFGGGGSFAMAVNNGGLIVGFNFSDDFTSQHAIAWRNGVVTDIGASFAGSSRAQAVNERGTAVGFKWPPPSEPFVFHTAVFEDGEVVDLGTLPGDTNSQALAINNRGTIVGNSFDENFRERAFIFQQGMMLDLNSLVLDAKGVFLLRAKGINNEGIIIAEGRGPDGTQHAVVLLPAEDQAAE